MKLKKVLVLAFLSMLVVSCSTVKFESNTKVIELEGNPTTGYLWVYSIEDDSIIKVEEESQYLGNDGVVGAPSLFKYIIKSVKAGSTSITFEYKRPWEDSMLKKVHYEVKVKTNGEIVVTEKYKAVV